MTDLATLLIFAAAGFGLARWLRFPVIPILMFIGISLSLAGVTPPKERMANVLELGLTFLVFAAGVELNPGRFKLQRRAVFWASMVQFFVTGLFGFSAARLLGYSPVASLYLAMALTSSSTLVGIYQLKQRHEMFEPFGRLVTGVLLVQDLLIITLIVMLAKIPEGLAAVLVAVGATFILGALSVACQRWVLPKLIIRGKLDEETILLILLACLFTFIGLSNFLGLPLIAGAFFAGFSLSAFPINGVVRGLLSSLSDFFLAIFFTVLGTFVTIPEFPALLKALAFAGLVIVLTPPLVALVAEWTGLTSRAAIESGLLLAQTSEFSLVVGLTGLLLNQLSPEIFSMIVLVTVVTMSLTPFLATDAMARRLLHLHPLWRRLKTEPAVADHVLILGFGAAGMWVVKPLMSEGHEVLVVDDDPAVIEQLQKASIPCLRGDASDEKMLEKAGAGRAKLIISSMRRVSDVENLVRRVKDAPVVVRLFEESDAERIRRLGGIPVLNSHAAAETFMEWYEKAGPGAHNGK